MQSQLGYLSCEPVYHIIPVYTHIYIYVCYYILYLLRIIKSCTSMFYKNSRATHTYIYIYTCVYHGLCVNMYMYRIIPDMSSCVHAAMFDLSLESRIHTSPPPPPPPGIPDPGTIRLPKDLAQVSHHAAEAGSLNLSPFLGGLCVVSKSTAFMM